MTLPEPPWEHAQAGRGYGMLNATPKQLMALPSLSFALGLLVITYLLSFVLFAIIRIATGVSIQRLGYLSLRRIAYTPRDGIRIEIRGLGLHLHRPTFARPTWISVRLTDLKVTVDPWKDRRE
jgi:hypothetical protein